MKKTLFATLSAVVFTVLSANVYAAQQTTTLDVTVTVAQACSVTAIPVSFAGYDGTAANATGDVTVTCPQGTDYNIALDAGNNNDGTYRRMVDAGATSFLSYFLYQDDINTEWGDSDYDNTYPGGASLAGTGSNGPDPHPVYGFIPSGQNPADGLHSDTVNVTVYY